MPTHVASRGGQILVIFALSLVVLIGMTGLALDGGSDVLPAPRPADRRRPGRAGRRQRLPHQQRRRHGHRPRPGRRGLQRLRRTGSDGTVVDVDVDTSNGVDVTVGDRQAAPRTASSAHRRDGHLAGVDRGAGPGRLPGQRLGRLAVHLPDQRLRRRRDAQVPDARRTSARPTATSRSATRTSPGPTTGPATSTRRRSATSSTGRSTINKTLAYGEYIGQHNNGNHTQLFQDVDTYLSGLDLPVAVVDASGNFMGWATFHVNSADAGSDKHISGYFVSSFDSARLTVSELRRERVPALPRVLRPQAGRLTRVRQPRPGRAIAASSAASTVARGIGQRAVRHDDARGRAPGPLDEVDLGGDPALRVGRVQAPTGEARPAGPPASRRRPRSRRRRPRSRRPRRGSPRARRPGHRSPDAASRAARIGGRTAGWTMASRSARAAGSANTIRPSAARSSSPSGPSEVVPEPRGDRGRGRLAGPGHLPGDLVGIDDDRRRALARWAATVDLPQPIGPVRPIRTGPAGRRRPAHGARSSRSSQASSAAASACSTSASSLVTRPIST